MREQLALDYPADDADTEPATPPARRPAPADRSRFLALLEQATRRVWEEHASAVATGPPSSPEAARLRTVVGNAQRFAARTERAIEALPEVDLGLLSGQVALAAAIREALAVGKAVRPDPPRAHPRGDA